MSHININPSDARDVLDVLSYHNHDGDCGGGDFKRNLITAIICAGPAGPCASGSGLPQPGCSD